MLFRSGAQWALSLMLSWYPDTDIEVFNDGPRAVTNYSELRLQNGVDRTASTIAEFVDFDDFIPPIWIPRGRRSRWMKTMLTMRTRAAAPARRPRLTSEDPGMPGVVVFTT